MKRGFERDFKRGTLGILGFKWTKVGGGASLNQAREGEKPSLNVIIDNSCFLSQVCFS